MKKKILSLGLVIMLILSMFVLTACGDEAESDKDSSKNDDEVVEENTDDEEETNEDEGNRVYSEADKDNQETAAADVEDQLEMAITSVQSDFMSDYFVNDNRDAKFKEYATKSKVEEYLPNGYELNKFEIADYSEDVYEILESELTDYSEVDDIVVNAEITYKNVIYGFFVMTNKNDTGAKTVFVEVVE